MRSIVEAVGQLLRNTDGTLVAALALILASSLLLQALAPVLSLILALLHR